MLRLFFPFFFWTCSMSNETMLTWFLLSGKSPSNYFCTKPFCKNNNGVLFPFMGVAMAKGVTSLLQETPQIPRHNLAVCHLCLATETLFILNSVHFQSFLSMLKTHQS